MTDSATNQPIRVADQDKDYLSIVVSVKHLDPVRAVLEANGVRFWVAHQQISIDGGPYMVRINLRRGTDAQHVQAMLDTVA